MTERSTPALPACLSGTNRWEQSGTTKGEHSEINDDESITDTAALSQMSCSCSCSSAAAGRATSGAASCLHEAAAIEPLCVFFDPCLDRLAEVDEWEPDAVLVPLDLAVPLLLLLLLLPVSLCLCFAPEPEHEADLFVFLLSDMVVRGGTSCSVAGGCVLGGDSDKNGATPPGQGRADERRRKQPDGEAKGIRSLFYKTAGPHDWSKLPPPSALI